MDDILRQLLSAESAANALVDKSHKEGERLVQGALDEARQQDARFDDRKGEIHSAFLDKADQRAEQMLAEMDRRFQERLVQLREAAEANEEVALDAAFALLLGGDRGAEP